MPGLMDIDFNDPNWFNKMDPEELGMLLSGNTGGYNNSYLRKAKALNADKWSWMKPLTRSFGHGKTGRTIIDIMRPGITDSSITGLSVGDRQFPTGKWEYQNRIPLLDLRPKKDWSGYRGRTAPTTGTGGGWNREKGVKGEYDTRRQYTPGQSGSSGSQSGGAAEPVPGYEGVPTPDYVNDMIARMVAMFPQLQNRFANITNEGIFGETGIRNILDPLESSQDKILQSLEPYYGEMTGMYDDQTRELLNMLATSGADRRRRMTAATSDDMARIGVNRPGVAQRMQSESMTPLLSDQANREFTAGMGGMEQKMDLRSQIEDIMRSLVSARGENRSGLIKENLASKTMGLSGLMDLINQQQGFVNNRTWDTKDPMSKQWEYGTGMADIMHGYGNQDAYRDFKNQMRIMQEQLRLKQEWEAWLANNNLGQYMDDDGTDWLGIGLDIASFIPGPQQPFVAGGNAAYRGSRGGG